jgi:hypothetical protein
MERFVLLGLLAIPILVVVHVALFWQPVGPHSVIFWTTSQDEDRVQLQGHWQSSEQVLPMHYVVVQKTERGS